jgi:pentatricopeptide repeat protein
MILHDVAPDAACYAPLIRAQLRKGDLESGVQLLSQMQRQQIEPDSATFQVGVVTLWMLDGDIIL